LPAQDELTLGLTTPAIPNYLEDRNAPVLAHNLSALADEARLSAKQLGRRLAVQVVAFFDLSGSTAAKTLLGNLTGGGNSVAFVLLANRIVTARGGQVIKNTGDGVLCTFADAVHACEAALNLRHATTEYLGLDMTSGMAAGAPMGVRLDGVDDIVGEVVDRAARVQSMAVPGQILIDRALHDQVRAYLIERPGVLVSDKPRVVVAKGIGNLDLYEIALTPHWKLLGQIATPFAILAGRPDLHQKQNLIADAQEEIIEIGIGLTSFAKYFTGENPDSFRDPIRQLVKRGVNFKCFALNPAYQPGIEWLGEQANSNYAEEARIAREMLIAEKHHCKSERYRGTFEYYTYDRVPEFWCLGVDVNDAVSGRMFFASYMMGVPRSEMPVTQISMFTYPALYKAFLRSIEAVRDASTERSRHLG
jgi:class 3 adenylate cyclase